MITFIIILISIQIAFMIISMVTGIHLIDFYKPKRWRAVYVWLLKKQLDVLGETNTYLKRHQLIQYAYRVGQCWECVKSGKCVNCKCDIEGRMNGEDDVCSAGKWGVMLDEQEFENEVIKTGLIDRVNINVEEDV